MEADEEAPNGWRQLWDAAAAPPGPWFHLALALPVAGVLYAWSFPGFDLVTAALALPFLALCFAGWAVRVAAAAAAGFRHPSGRSPRWFLAAPLLGLAVVVALALDAPLRARWAMSRGAFEEAVDAAPSPNEHDLWTDYEAPGRLGTYEITNTMWVGDGMLFSDRNGSLFAETGFAYLPSGPPPELGSGAYEFRSLGSGWYAWTVSW